MGHSEPYITQTSLDADLSDVNLWEVTDSPVLRSCLVGFQRVPLLKILPGVNS